MKQTLSLTSRAAALIVGLAMVPLASSAQPAPSYTPVPVAQPDFSTMMFLSGTWTCTQMLRGKKRSDTSVTTMGLNGAWMVTQDSAPPFDQYRNYTIDGTTYTTYDPAIKQWVQVEVDSGGGYSTESSPGWQGNTMTFTGKGLDGSSTIDAITKISDTAYTDDSSAVDATGKATKVTIHCAKSGS